MLNTKSNINLVIISYKSPPPPAIGNSSSKSWLTLMKLGLYVSKLRELDACGATQ